MKKTIPLFFAILSFSTLTFSQNDQKSSAMHHITPELISAQLDFLASDWMEGRNTGEKGAYMAADYVASMFKSFGLKPGGDYLPRSRRSPRDEERTRSYFQNFDLLEYRSGDNLSVSLVAVNDQGTNEIVLQKGADFSLTSGTRAVMIESPLVFVGYGFTGEGYDDFDNIDVTGKIILRMAGFPGHRNPDSKGYKKFAQEGPYSAYYIERAKNQHALEAGAAAVIEIRPQGQRFRAYPENIPFRYNEKNWEGNEPFRNTPRTRMTRPDQMQSGLPVLNLADHVLDLIWKNQDFDLQKFEDRAEQKMKGSSFYLTDQMIKISTTVESRVIQARNVIAVLEGEKTDSCIVVGAHYDHVGKVRNFIYNGSDDNASGTVGIMTIAKAMVETGIKPTYTLVFCAWTGEEKGLIGSAYYADNPLIDNIKCYMNYDMISRVALDDPNKNKCDFQYTSTIPLLKDLTVQHIEEYAINLDMNYKGSQVPMGGSDYSSFSRKGIPIFLLHGKFTPDYHHFTDHSDKADLPYMRDIIRVGFLNIFELATQTW